MKQKSYPQQVAVPKKSANGPAKGIVAVEPFSVPEKPTILEGVRAKVFSDRYSWKDEVGQSIEKYPEQMWGRVAKAISSVEKTPQLRKIWQEKFYDALSGFKFLPGGRILSAAGTGYEVTFYNCLPPDQEVLTPDGYKPIKDIKVNDRVITGKKRERRVKHVFTRETEELLYIIRPTKLGFDDVRLTGEHPVLTIKSDWVNNHRSRDGLHLKDDPQWVKAADLKKGDFVAVGWNQHISALSKIHLKDYLPKTFESHDGFLMKSQLKKPVKDEVDIDEKFMLLVGTWLGDGCVTHRTGTDIPTGIQITFNKHQKDWAQGIAYILREKFAIVPTVREDRWGQRLIQVRVESYPVGLFFKNFFGAYSYKKKIPSALMEQPTERILPLIKGLFRSDGYLSDTHLGIALSNKHLAIQLHQLLLRTGRFFTIFQNNARNGRHDTYRVTAGVSQANGLCEYIFGEKKTNTHHDQDYFLTYEDLFWVRIDTINTATYKGIVYDLEVEEDHSFITGGVVVSNCFVIPSPADSRGGIIDNLKVMIEIMSRAGGVGINLSSLRPRGARVYKVNGTSSGPVNWANLYSVGTHDVIQQGGCFTGDSLIMTHLGLVAIEEIIQTRRDWYVATHKGYKKVTAKFDNGVKKVYQVKTEAGFKVNVTAEHRFLTFDRDGQFYLQPLAKLKEGGSIVLLLGDWSQDIPYVPLNTYLPKPSKYSYGRIKVNLPKFLHRELAFLIGVYDADGSKVQDEYSQVGKGLRIAVAGNRTKDLKTLTQTLKEVFGLEPKVDRGDGDVYNVCIYSREVNEFLNLNGLLKQSSVSVEVPKLIFSSPKEVVGGYIAGVFSGDGGNRGGKGGFRLSTVSERFAHQLQLLLLNLGIPAKIQTQIRDNKNWQPLHTVTINGHRFMEKFSKLIASYTEKTNDKQISVRDGAFNWPINLTERFVYLTNFQRTIARTNPTTSQKAVLFLEQRQQIIHEEDKTDVEIFVSCVSDQIASIDLIGEENVYDVEVDEVHLLSGNGFYTSNSRRGALMLMLNDWHPDVEEFIEVKKDLSRINGANLSVCVSDGFMEAVEKDLDWTLRFPDTKFPGYDELWDGDILDWEAKGYPVKIYKVIKAKAIWEKICQAAWTSAEPGLHFLERSNKQSNTWYFEKLLATNPCGEQPLGAWAVCNLGALNLSAFVEDGQMNYARLAEYAAIATRFLDNVVDANFYFYEDNEKQQKGIRRTGLGTMGLGDALIKMKVRYGSDQSLEVIEKIYKTIRDTSYEASADLAAEKGPFPKFDKEKYLQGYFIKQLPDVIKEKIAKNGIRNAVVLTQAPTGTTSLLAGVSSGIEPVYDFKLIRRDRTGEHVIYHSLYREWQEANPGVNEMPDYFVAANDLTPDDHVRVQAMIQKYTDSSISKTVNAPNSHTVDQVRELYMKAYKLGCKGVTYMRDGSREGVLSHADDKPKTSEQPATLPQPTHRAAVLNGRTYKMLTPVGEAFITINRDEMGQPMEVFATIGKAGMQTGADAEAIGRLISLALRIADGSRMDVAKKIISQLRGIGGSSQVGFGKNRVMSLGDAIAKVLAEELSLASDDSGQFLTLDLSAEQLSIVETKTTLARGDLCPECGESTFVLEEGCSKCYSCGYSKC